MWDAAPASRIVAVRALPLPLGRHAQPDLPDWATDAVLPRVEPWPEEARAFVLELAADDGTTGRYGPCSSVTIELVRDQLLPGLLGTDVFAHRAVEATFAVVGRHRTGAHFRIAQSAVELALWDLRSRSAGVAVVRLLGGPVRETVACYASALGVDVDHPLAPDVARWLADSGYGGQKWKLPGFSRGEEPVADVARLTRLRDAIGADARLMVDAGGRWSVDYLRRIAPALAELGVAWLEEPIGGAPVSPPPHEVRSGCVGLALAAGEHAFEPVDQLRWLLDTADVWQPDVGWNGGIVQTLRTVDLAATLGIPVYPHGGCLVGALVVGGLTTDQVLPAVEYHVTLEPVRQAHALEPLAPTRGRLDVLAEPGLSAYAVDADAAVDLGVVADGVL